MRYATLALMLCLVASSSIAQIQPGQRRTLEPVGEYAQIDTRLVKETIDLFSKGSEEERVARVKDIRANPQNYAPPVFYLLSRVLFQSGLKDEAAFWFYAGQLRARYDANRCADPSAAQAVASLNDSFGGPINAYMFQQLPKLEALIPKVVEWDERTAHNYDHRWINLSGMNAVMASLGKDAGKEAPSLSLPKERWPQIAEDTRRDYLNGFRQALAKAKQGAAK